MRALAAAKEIHEHVRGSGSMAIPKDIDLEGALTLTVDSWLSMLSHYAEGFKLDTISTVTIASAAYSTVRLRAAAPRDERVMKELETPGGATSAPAESVVREEALARGVCPPVDAGIEIGLKKVEGAWRVLKIGLGPATQAVPQIPLDAFNMPTSAAAAP
jgi:hypothetical protein